MPLLPKGVRYSQGPSLLVASGAPALSQSISVFLSSSVIGELVGGMGGFRLPFMRRSASSDFGILGLFWTLKTRKSSIFTNSIGAPFVGTGP